MSRESCIDWHIWRVRNVHLGQVAVQLVAQFIVKPAIDGQFGRRERERQKTEKSHYLFFVSEVQSIYGRSYKTGMLTLAMSPPISICWISSRLRQRVLFIQNEVMF